MADEHLRMYNDTCVCERADTCVFFLAPLSEALDLESPSLTGSGLDSWLTEDSNTHFKKHFAAQGFITVSGVVNEVNLNTS